MNGNLGITAVSNIPDVLNRVGQYYNAVTDTTQTLPVNAPSNGNDPNAVQPALSSVWDTLYSGTTNVVSTVEQAATTVGHGVTDTVVGAYDATKSAVSGAENAIGGAVSGIQTGVLKWGFILIAVGLVVVVVVGRSGIVGQAAGFGRP